jgi:hypothetical protein
MQLLNDIHSFIAVELDYDDNILNAILALREGSFGHENY